MIYVSDDIRALYLSRDTLSNLGVLSPKFAFIRKHQQSLEWNGTTPDTEQPQASLVQLQAGALYREV